MISVDVSGTIGKAVEEYTGAKVLDLEVVPDLPGTFAVQALVKDGPIPYTIQFILAPKSLLDINPWTELEEVEFTMWPPTRRV